MLMFIVFFVFFFFNDTATTEIYTLSLHDALPICLVTAAAQVSDSTGSKNKGERGNLSRGTMMCSLTQTSSRRSEEHTSELQSRQYLVCRLLLEKKKKKKLTNL